jgi:L-lactate dehydrogenase complex protein LldE
MVSRELAVVYLRVGGEPLMPMGLTVGLFVPCFVDELWPQAGRAAVELIEKLGFGVAVGEAVCCGQALSNAGEEAEARRVRALWSRAHAAFSEVVVLSASCAGYLRKSAPNHQDPRVSEFCEWYSRYAPERFERPVPRRLALHSSCASLRETGTARHVRDLLDRVPGLEIAEPDQADECCGFGGSFASTFPELSVKIGRDKMANLLAAARGIDGVVSADCSCLLHLRGLASPETRFFHVAEVLRESVS